MPGTVYTVASGKGGVGKTTTAVNLAVAVWRAGNSVAMVDADLGMANLAAVLDLEPELTLHDVLAGQAILDEAIVEARGGDLLVLPGSRELSGFAAANPQKLRDVLDDLALRCEFVIVDTGAGLGYEDVLPLGLADAVVLVSSPDPAALGDTRKTAELAALVETPVSGLVVTRAVEGTDSEAMAAEIGTELLGTIPEDPVVMESTVAGDPLESYAPDSAAAAAYRELADSILEAGPPAAAPAGPGTTGSGAGEDGGGDEAAPSGSGASSAGEPADAGDAEATEGRDSGDESGGSSSDTDEDADGEAEEADEPADEEPAESVAEPAEESADGHESDAEAVDAAADADEQAAYGARRDATDAEEGPDGEGTAEDEAEPEAADEDEVDGEGTEPEAAPDEGEVDEDEADPEEVGEDDVEQDEAEQEAAADEEAEAGGSGGLRGWLGRLFS